MKQHQRVVGSSTDDADDDLESPRNFLKKKNAVEALPDSDSPAAGAAAVKARAVRSSSITARAVAFEGVKPLIKRHRLVTAAITADTDGKLDFHSLSVAAAKTPAEWDGVVAPSPKCAGGDDRGTQR